MCPGGNSERPQKLRTKHYNTWYIITVLLGSFNLIMSISATLCHCNASSSFRLPDSDYVTTYPTTGRCSHVVAPKSMIFQHLLRLETRLQNAAAIPLYRERF